MFGHHLVIPSSSTFTAANKAFCRWPRIAAASILSVHETKNAPPTSNRDAPPQPFVLNFRQLSIFVQLEFLVRRKGWIMLFCQ